jgi:hypothetical protein
MPTRSQTAATAKMQSTVEDDQLSSDEESIQVITREEAHPEPSRTQTDRTPTEDYETLLLQEKLRAREAEIKLLHATIENNNLRAQAAQVNPIAGNLPSTRPYQASERKFKEHKSTYAGKSLIEYRAWVDSIERDHEYFERALRDEADKVYHAQQTLTAKSKASKRWQAIAKTPGGFTWATFKEEMLNVLGSQETRQRQTYTSWLNAEWRGDPNTTTSYLETLEGLMPEELGEVVKLYHFWNLVPKEIATRMLQQSGDHKTRDELVTALNFNIEETKRLGGQTQNQGQSQSSGNNRGREKTRGDRSSNRGRDNGKRSDRDPPATGEEPETKRQDSRTRDPDKPTKCNNCGRSGHIAENCRSARRPFRGRGGGSGFSSPNNIPVRQGKAAATSPAKGDSPTGKDQAS